MEVLDIYGLAFGCTFCDERDDCLFKEIRKIKDFEKRIELIESMSYTEKQELVYLHKICSLQREIELRKLNSNNVEQKND
jgi:hypothetical protein